MSDSWVVQNLNNALNTWNEKLAEVWQLLLMSPQSFKGGGIKQRSRKQLYGSDNDVEL